MYIRYVDSLFGTVENKLQIHQFHEQLNIKQNKLTFTIKVCQKDKLAQHDRYYISKKVIATMHNKPMSTAILLRSLKKIKNNFYRRNKKKTVSKRK